MKLDEAYAGKKVVKNGREVVTVKVSEHKTGSSERAAISYCGETVDHFRSWLEVRAAIPQLKGSPYVFPTLNGGKYEKLTQLVQKIAMEKRRIALPTTQSMRSNIEIRASTLDTPTQALVARQLSHSKVTAEKNYRALQASDRATAFEAVGKVMGVPPTSSPSPIQPKHKRNKFTLEDEKVLKSFFLKYIEEKKVPKKEAIMPLFQAHPQFADRSYKDIYDKIRNFFRYQ